MQKRRTITDRGRSQKTVPTGRWQLQVAKGALANSFAAPAPRGRNLSRARAKKAL